MTPWTPRRFPLLIAFLAAAACLVAITAQAGDAEKPMVVKIHADWCGTCTKLDTTFEEIEAQAPDARIVILDVTDKQKLTESTAKADELGIREFFDANKGKTGTVGVFDAKGDIIVVKKGELDASVYVAALKQAQGA